MTLSSTTSSAMSGDRSSRTGGSFFGSRRFSRPLSALPVLLFWAFAAHPGAGVHPSVPSSGGGAAAGPTNTNSQHQDRGWRSSRTSRRNRRVSHNQASGSGGSGSTANVVPPWPQFPYPACFPGAAGPEEPYYPYTYCAEAAQLGMYYPCCAQVDGNGRVVSVGSAASAFASGGWGAASSTWTAPAQAHQEQKKNKTQDPRGPDERASQLSMPRGEGAWLPPQLRKEEMKKDDGVLEEPRAAAQAHQAEAPCVVPLTLQNLNKLQKEQEAKKAEKLYPYQFTAYDCQGVRLVTAPLEPADQEQEDQKEPGTTPTQHTGDAHAEQEITTQGSGADVGSKRKGRYAEQTITPWTVDHVGNKRGTTTCALHKANFLLVTYLKSLLSPEALLGTDGRVLHGEKYMGEDECSIKLPFDLVPMNSLPRRVVFESDGVELVGGISEEQQKMLHVDQGVQSDKARLEFVKAFLVQKARSAQMSKTTSQHDLQLHHNWLLHVRPQDIGLVEIRSPGDDPSARIRKRGYFPEGTAQPLSFRNDVRSKGTWDPKKNKLQVKGVNRPTRDIHNDFSTFLKTPRDGKIGGKAVEDLTFGDVGVRIHESGKEGVGKMIVLGGVVGAGGATANGGKKVGDEMKMKTTEGAAEDVREAAQEPTAGGSASGEADTSSGEQAADADASAAMDVDAAAPVSPPGTAPRYSTSELDILQVVDHEHCAPTGTPAQVIKGASESESPPSPLQCPQELVPILRSSIFLDAVSFWTPLEIPAGGWPLGFVAKKLVTEEFTTALADVEQAIAKGAETSGGGEADALLAFFEENMTAASAWIWSSARVYHGALPLNLSEPRYSAESRYAVYDKSKWRHYSKKQLRDALEKVEQKHTEMQAKKTSGRKFFNSKLLAEVEKEKNMLRERVYGGEERLENVLLYWQWVRVGSDLFAVMEKWLSR